MRASLCDECASTMLQDYGMRTEVLKRQLMALFGNEPSGRKRAVTDRPERIPAVAADFGRILRTMS